MNRGIHILSAWTLLATSTALAAAPQPAPGVLTKKQMREAAITLINKLDGDGALQQQTRSIIDQQIASLNTVPCVQAAMPEVRSLLENALDSNALRGKMVDLYASNFTLDELEWMVNFYDTPLGKKWITFQPKLMNSIQTITTNRLKEAEPKISAAIASTTKDARCQMQQRQGR